jgi:hypothetical protein
LALAFGSSLVLTLAASAARAWPFGAVRLNFFLFPLVLLLAVSGLSDAVQLARSQRLRALVGVVVGAIAGATLLVQTQRDVQMVAQTHWRMGGAAVEQAVAQIRGTAGPDDLVVLTSRGQAPPRVYMHGWYFYLQTYEGYPSTLRGRPVREDQILSMHGQPVPPVLALLARHPDAGQVFVVRAWQDKPPDPALVRALEAAGFCRSAARQLYFTGRMDTFSRSDCPRR